MLHYAQVEKTTLYMEVHMSFNHNKLRGRIKEVCSIQSDFAALLSISNTSLSKKLNNKAPFTQKEIKRAVEILGIEEELIGEYFFTQKV